MNKPHFAKSRKGTLPSSEADGKATRISRRFKKSSRVSKRSSSPDTLGKNVKPREGSMSRSTSPPPGGRDSGTIKWLRAEPTEGRNFYQGMIEFMDNGNLKSIFFSDPGFGVNFPEADKSVYKETQVTFIRVQVKSADGNMVFETATKLLP